MALAGAAHAGDLTLDDLFSSDRVLDVQVTLAEEDWNELRNQTRTFWGALSEKRKYAPVGSPFTYFDATVTLDGIEFANVGVRKKGFLGSLSDRRPSLKIKLNHTDPEGAIDGLNNLTFNNNQQDISLMSQFLGYRFFDAVDSPAPRCGLANITVNGKNLGIYAHVESFRPPLFEREFGDAGGTLFEGTVVDFHEGWAGSFEYKFGDEEAGRVRIQGVIDILNDAGSTVLAEASERRAWVPGDDSLGDSWTAVDFDDSQWLSGRGGAGYEIDSGYEPHIDDGLDVREQLHGKGTSLYMRVPFDLVDPEKIEELVLRMHFDDGFVAYLNGHRVVSSNAPEPCDWQSRATSPHDDRVALYGQPFVLSEHVDKLRPGKNVLAIHGLNREANSTDMLILPELRAGESPVPEALEKLVDLESFLVFWATESLLGFWDGYSGNRNNYYLYLDPKSDKLHFLPWGADALFEKLNLVNMDTSAPQCVKLSGLLAHRLYHDRDYKQRYQQTLSTILEQHWNEEKLLAEVDRLEALLTPFVQKIRRQMGPFRFGLTRNRQFIKGRRQELLAEMKDGMPIWTKPPAEPAFIPSDGNWFGGDDEKREDDLWNAARRGDVAAMEKHLEKTDIDQLDGMGSTALSWAVGLGRVDAVKLLLEKGADVNVRNLDGTRPLDHTLDDIEEEVVAFLRNAFRLDLDRDTINSTRAEVEKLLRERGAKIGEEE